jgi:hypothetical protein
MTAFDRHRGQHQVYHTAIDNCVYRANIVFSTIHIKNYKQATLVLRSPRLPKNTLRDSQDSEAVLKWLRQGSKTEKYKTLQARHQASNAQLNAP